MITFLQEYMADAWHELKTDRSTRYTAIAALSVALLTSGYFSWNWYAKNRDEAALEAFSRVYALHRQAQGNSQRDWNAVIQAWEQEYQDHRSAHLAPFFHAFQADALENAGKLAEAETLLAQTLPQLKAYGPYYYAYATKLALMHFSSEDATTKEAGRIELTALADDLKNPVRDAALYHLGHDMWWFGSGCIPQQWQTLRSEFGSESIWAQKAHNAMLIPVQQ